jgi:c-di-GMP phosphodiesterase
MVRQPVFSRDGDLIGYEIRFRDTPEGREAFSQSLLTGSFDSLRGDRPAFVPVSRGQFLEQIIQLADPLAVIPLIPNDVGDDASVLEAIERFCAAGGQIAIDQLGETINASDTLLPLAHWVRIDVRSEDYATLSGTSWRVRACATDTLLIADHVYETSQLAMAERLGFDAFEGAHFSRPEPLPSAEAAVVHDFRAAPARSGPRSQRARSYPRGVDRHRPRAHLSAAAHRQLCVGGRARGHVDRTRPAPDRPERVPALAVAGHRRLSARRHGRGRASRATGRGTRAPLRAAGRVGARRRHAVSRRPLFAARFAVFRVSIEELVSRVALTDDAREALLERTGPYAPSAGLRRDVRTRHVRVGRRSREGDGRGSIHDRRDLRRGLAVGRRDAGPDGRRERPQGTRVA